MLIWPNIVVAQPPFFLDEWAVPDRVYRCLEKAGSRSREPLRPFGALNPYYLRGDFFGVGHSDIAIAVVGTGGPQPRDVAEAYNLLAQRENGGIGSQIDSPERTRERRRLSVYAWLAG